MKNHFNTHFLFALLLMVSNSLAAQNWEVDLLDKINPSNPNYSSWRTISNTTYPVALGIPAGIWLISRIGHNKKNERNALETGGGILFAAAATEGLKIIINRQRPYEQYPLLIHPYDNSETGRSFPSAHTSLAFATATSLSIQYKKWYIVLPAYAWAASVGYSRLYLGEHYPTDVLAGAVVGTGSAWLAHWLNQKYFSKKK